MVFQILVSRTKPYPTLPSNQISLFVITISYKFNIYEKKGNRGVATSSNV